MAQIKLVFAAKVPHRPAVATMGACRRPDRSSIATETQEGRAHKEDSVAPGATLCIRGPANGSIHGLEPVVNVLAHAVLGEAVALLDLAFELIALAVDQGQIVVGELAPLLLDLALGLFPVSFDTVPIHSSSPA